jgi:hypothetical protein
LGISRLWDRIAPGQVEYAATTHVDATTIDRLVTNAGWSRLDFIKLDLEGGEFYALRGAGVSMKRFRLLIVTKHSMHAPAANGFTVQDYFDWLASVGYGAADPAGQPASVARPFPFWYLFLVPLEAMPGTVEDIRRVVAKFI